MSTISDLELSVLAEQIFFGREADIALRTKDLNDSAVATYEATIALGEEASERIESLGLANNRNFLIAFGIVLERENIKNRLREYENILLDEEGAQFTASDENNRTVFALIDSNVTGQHVDTYYFNGDEMVKIATVNLSRGSFNLLMRGI